MYSYVIFDLDGTLLNTIDDLADTGNHVCALHGWPAHPVEAYKRMVGNGIPKLVERFAPAGTDRDTLDQAYGEFMAWYGLHKEDKTAPYPGMEGAALRLKQAGVSIAVLSNKADEMAGPVVEHYYPGVFPIVQGALPDLPTKPDPTPQAHGAHGGGPGSDPLCGGQQCGHPHSQERKSNQLRRAVGLPLPAGAGGRGGRLSGRDPGGADKGGAGRWLRTSWRPTAWCCGR